MRDLYALGFTQAEIGARLGMSKQRVSQILNLPNNPELQRLHRARGGTAPASPRRRRRMVEKSA